jgi:septum formation protein
MTFQVAAPPLVLASASAARCSLLEAAGLTLESVSARIDEAAVKQAAQAEGAPADEAALLLASLKAERVARTRRDALVIGCDQILVCDGEWFDKPGDAPAAADQLRRLRGRTHELVTAVVCHRNGEPVWQHVAKPRLAMRRFSDEFLGRYLAAEGDTVLASVGAYRMEGPGVLLFDRVEGEHAAILGLPLLGLLGFLRQHGVLIG